MPERSLRDPLPQGVERAADRRVPPGRQVPKNRRQNVKKDRTGIITAAETEAAGEDDRLKTEILSEEADHLLLKKRSRCPVHRMTLNRSVSLTSEHG